MEDGALRPSEAEELREIPRDGLQVMRHDVADSLRSLAMRLGWRRHPLALRRPHRRRKSLMEVPRRRYRREAWFLRVHHRSQRRVQHEHARLTHHIPLRMMTTQSQCVAVEAVSRR